MTEIRSMGFEDIEAVVKIEKENFSVPWDENGFLSFMLREGTIFLTALKDNEVVGYCGLISAADEADITNVSVSQSMRKKGIGGMLLSELIKEAGESGSSISDKFIQEKELQNRPQMIKTEVDWEAEGDWESGTEGTTILNYGNESEKEDGKICHPMLRDMELGIIYVIKNCPFYIGSAEGVNHLHIQDKTVSREHAVILEDIYEGDGQGYILRDMGSTNGTWLNGKKIKRGNQEQLEDGAVIRFAKKEYEFLIQDI